MELTTEGKPIRDVIEWPPSVWAGAIGTPSAATAKIDEAVIRRKNLIRLRVTDEGRTYTTSIEITDDSLHSRIVQVLSGAKGRTLLDAGGGLILLLERDQA